MLEIHTSFLRQARYNCGLSMKQAAKKLGIDKSTLSRYESGKSKMKAAILLRMADAYNLQIGEFLKEVHT